MLQIMITVKKLVYSCLLLVLLNLMSYVFYEGVFTAFSRQIQWSTRCIKVALRVLYFFLVLLCCAIMVDPRVGVGTATKSERDLYESSAILLGCGSQRRFQHFAPRSVSPLCNRNVRLKHENSRDEYAVGFVFSYLIYSAYVANYGLCSSYLAFMVFVAYTASLLVRALQTEVLAWQRSQDQLGLLRLYEELVMQLNTRRTVDQAAVGDAHPPVPNRVPAPAPIPAPAAEPRRAETAPLPQTQLSPVITPRKEPESMAEDSKHAEVPVPSPVSEEIKQPVTVSVPVPPPAGAPIPEETKAPPRVQPAAVVKEIAVQEPEGTSSADERNLPSDGSSSGQGEECKKESGEEISKLLGQIPNEDERLVRRNANLRTINEVESRMEQSSSNLPLVDVFDSKEIDEGLEFDVNHKMRKYN